MKDSNYKIGLYVRVSTKEQAENPEGSIKNQKQRLLEEVSRKNEKEFFGKVVHIYCDEGLSAKDTKRPAYQNMLRDIRAKKINMIMTSELSRISRNLKYFCLFWDELKSFKCGLISLRESYDTSTVMGEFMVQHGVLMSQHERMMIKDRVTQGMNDRAKRGLFNGGNIPFGYELIPDKKGYLAINEEQKDIVIQAFELFIQNEGLASTAKVLNQRGLRIHERSFTVSSLDYLLNNRTYLGIRRFKDKGEIKEVKACWEPIIDEVKFEKVQKLLKLNRFSRKSPSKSRYPYLLSGLCFCAHCGDPLVGKSAHGNSGKVGYYAHGKKIKRLSCDPSGEFECEGRKRYPAKKLEPVVLEKVGKILEDEMLLKRIWQRSQNISDNTPVKKEMDFLLKNLERIKKEEKNLAGRIAKLPEDIPAEALYGQLKTLAGQKQEVEKRICEMTPARELEDACSLAEFREFVGLVNDCLNKADDSMKTKLIAKLIHRIEVGEKEVKIWFYVGSETIRGQRNLCSLFLKESGEKKFLVVNSSTELTNGGNER